jgi:hypothetical protein
VPLFKLLAAADFQAGDEVVHYRPCSL